ncbi:Gamma-glutamylcysteine synthetase [Pseudoloma neurophilia]|uniref:Glutamate--cysteine ligase n=1 Tax=Pseudoloma neurophilia TaxID=146866 RepID=A0A0R0LVM8_9MICR|nr:Gamma-glutamylcysteine synthetase [Pseudoloma neurophilia]
MGLLKTGKVLNYEEIDKIKHKIKERGIQQFINIYKKKKNITSNFSVGDEIELILTADQRGRKVLTLVSEEMIQCFNHFHGNVCEMLKNRDAIRINTEENCSLDNKNGELSKYEKTLNKYQDIIDIMKLPKHSKQELLYLLHYNLGRLPQENYDIGKKEMSNSDTKISLIPEFSSYMLETIPLTVQSSNFKNFYTDMYRRISLIGSLHKSFIPCSKVMMLTAFPMLYLDLEDLSTDFDSEKSVFFDKKISTYDFSQRAANITYNTTNSIYFPDNSVNLHPRFPGLVKNIIFRRKRQTEGYVATMNDSCVKNNTITVLGRIAPDEIERIEDRSKKQEEAENFLQTILIDSMGQGFGCACIQFTYQLENIEISKFIYDQLTILAPLLMRLMRASPYSTNHMLNIDSRWEIISMAVDDRTREESGFDAEIKGLCKCGECNMLKSHGFDVKYYSNRQDLKQSYIKTLGESEFDELNIPQWVHIRRSLNKKTFEKSDRQNVIKKSRYSASDLFLHKWGTNFNDTEVKIDENYRKILTNANIDENLANHVASLFKRDPLIFYDSPTEDYEHQERYDDFENIQSSNWRSTRFKIPIDDGWRVELRSLEIQPTVYENSNFAVFISSLVTWLISEFKNDCKKGINRPFFYVPMSKVESNFARASIFSHKESDYYDDNYSKNDKILEEFFDKISACPEENNKPQVNFSFIADKSKNYWIKTPEDNITFTYRDLDDEMIREGTISDIFVPICDLLSDKFPQYRSEISFVKELAQNKFASTADFIRYSLINDPDYVKGTSYINRNMTDRLIIKMDKIRKMDHWLYKKRTQ